MGGYVGKYSRSPFSVFNEEKNYPFALLQEGVPVTDDDENDSRIAGFTQMRRVVQLFGEYGTPNSSFNLLEGAAHAVESFAVTNTITLDIGEGDVSAQYFVGRKFTISGSTGTLNDGTFTVVSATSATPTVITTVETVVAELASPAISTLNVNNFTVSTLAGPLNADIEQAGQFFMRGIRCVLMHDVDYENDLSDLARQSIHPRVTNNYFDTTNTIVEDSAANWITNELATRDVSFDGGGSWLTIVSNTTNSLTFSGDQTATIDNGDHYILRLSTPGGGRTDEVYLNVYIDEYDSTDDPTLEKELGGNAIEAQLRAKIIQTIFVREDSPGMGGVSDYVDANGNQHFVSKISTLTRDANDTITQAEITNSVLALGGDTSLAQIAPLEAAAQFPASDKVFVKAGQALSATGHSIVVWPGGDSPTFSNTHATDPRIDVLVLEEAGTLGIVEGTPHPTTPTVPAFYDNPVAIIDIASTGGGAPVISSGDITDARTLFTPTNPRGWVALFPERGTLDAQLNGNMVTGTRYWLEPGAWILGADIILDADDIVLAGTRDSVINLGAYEIDTTADRVRLCGMTVSTATPDITKGCLYFTGYDGVVEDVEVSSGGNARKSAIESDIVSRRLRVKNCTVSIRTGSVSFGAVHAAEKVINSKVTADTSNSWGPAIQGCSLVTDCAAYQESTSSVGRTCIYDCTKVIRTSADGIVAIPNNSVGISLCGETIGCDVTNFATGVRVAGVLSTAARVQDCNLQNCEFTGIHIDGPDIGGNMFVINNRIFGTGAALDSYSIGIWIESGLSFPGAPRLAGVYVDNNIISRYYRGIWVTENLANAGLQRWTPNTSYGLGVEVISVADENPRYFECTTAGTSGGTEPTWSRTVSATVNDNTAVWTVRERGSLIDQGGIRVTDNSISSVRIGVALTQMGSVSDNPDNRVDGNDVEMPDTGFSVGIILEIMDYNGGGTQLNGGDFMGSVCDNKVRAASVSAANGLGLRLNASFVTVNSNMMKHGLANGIDWFAVATTTNIMYASNWLQTPMLNTPPGSSTDGGNRVA